MSLEGCLALWALPGFCWVALILWRRVSAARQHISGLGGLAPVEAYAICHNMLNQMVYVAYTLLPTIDTCPPATWDRYTVSMAGLLVVPTHPTGPGLLAPLRWEAVSGIGVEMAPVYAYTPASRSFWDISTRVNTGYQLNLLIVPISGATLTIQLPLQNNEAAINFGAHMLAFARTHERRLSHIGFDKGLTRGIVHLKMF